jgi:protein gp37
MSDLFHEDVPMDYIARVFKVMEKAHWHTFQILTKRADRMAEFFMGRKAPRNAWLGVSVEDRAYGVPRIDCLRTVDAAIRFLSVEPLLEDVGALNLDNIHWVIVGGESGPGAPMKMEWVESIRDQCEAPRWPSSSSSGADGARMASSGRRSTTVGN